MTSPQQPTPNDNVATVAERFNQMLDKLDRVEHLTERVVSIHEKQLQAHSGFAVGLLTEWRYARRRELESDTNDASYWTWRNVRQGIETAYARYLQAFKSTGIVVNEDLLEDEGGTS